MKKKKRKEVKRRDPHGLDALMRKVYKQKNKKKEKDKKKCRGKSKDE